MQLRNAIEADISWIVEVEHAQAFREYIGQWSSEEHAAAMCDPDTRYFIAERDLATPLGYAILRGLQSEHRSLELRRIAIRDPGQGNGRQMIRLLLRKVFEEFGAHRLWLDVFETNTRAQHVYLSLGFQQEGLLREAIYRDGRYHSQILMSLLDREYQASVSQF